MLSRLKLKLNNRIMAWVGVAGVGLLPCPDCGIPLAVHVWPVAALVWGWRRLRQRSLAQLDLLLTGDLRADLREDGTHDHAHDRAHHAEQ